MKRTLQKLTLGVVAMVFSFSSYAQTYTFTNCAATGKYGPTQGQVNAAYTSPNTLTGAVTINTQGIQEWTVPTTGIYQIEVTGAQGGSNPNPGNNGGYGAKMIGDFNLTAGQVIQVLVGQVGGDSTTYYGGGGGSFVVTSTNTCLIAAGGGGGAGGSAGGPGVDASTGLDGLPGLSGGAGGVNGNGGTCDGGNGGAGGGFSTDGISNSTFCTPSGIAFLNGGTGGQCNTHLPGGFGGGGPAWHTTGNGGGGGGWSGGGTSSASYVGGGGGGSLNTGTNQTNTAGLGTGMGSVVITFIPTVGVNENIELAGVNIYPNPTNNILNITLGNISSDVNLTLTSVEGKVVYQENNISNNKVSVDISNNSKGIYFLKVEANNQYKVYKVIKE